MLNRFSEAIQQSRVDVVPKVVVGGGEEGGASGSNLMQGLLTMLLSEKMGVQLTGSGQPREVNPETERLRAEIRQGLAEKKDDKTQTPATPAAPMK